MDKREEIALWLRKAAVDYKNSGKNFECGLYNGYAAQVEAMRCDGCRWWERIISCHGKYLAITGYSVMVTEDFGCWHFERSV